MLCGHIQKWVFIVDLIASVRTQTNFHNELSSYSIYHCSRQNVSEGDGHCQLIRNFVPLRIPAVEAQSPYQIFWYFVLLLKTKYFLPIQVHILHTVNKRCVLHTNTNPKKMCICKCFILLCLYVYTYIDYCAYNYKCKWRNF